MTTPHQLLDLLRAENNNLRDLIHQLHLAHAESMRFHRYLLDQIRRKLYADPPPGIIYGEQTVDVGTQTFQPTDSD